MALFTMYFFVLAVCWVPSACAALPWAARAARRSAAGGTCLRGAKGVPRKGVWTSVNMRVWTCKELGAKHDRSSCYSRPPFLGTPVVSSRTWTSQPRAPWSPRRRSRPGLRRSYPCPCPRQFAEHAVRTNGRSMKICRTVFGRGMGMDIAAQGRDVLREGLLQGRGFLRNPKKLSPIPDFRVSPSGRKTLKNLTLQQTNKKLENKD